jgi:hypothetical protein
MDIRKSNNATVGMTIADFFHCKNIPDSVVFAKIYTAGMRVPPCWRGFCFASSKADWG